MEVVSPYYALTQSRGNTLVADPLLSMASSLPERTDARVLASALGTPRDGLPTRVRGG